jgi:WD40 repeat protein
MTVLLVGVLALLALVTFAAQHIGAQEAALRIAYSRAINCATPPCDLQIALVDPAHLASPQVLAIPPQADIDSISWSPAHNQLALSSIHHIGFYDLTHHQFVQPLRADDYVYFKEVTWSHSGQYIAFMGYEMLSIEVPDNIGYLNIYDTLRQHTRRVPIQRATFGTSPAWFATDDRLLLAMPNNEVLSSGLWLTNSQIMTYDMRSDAFALVTSDRLVGRTPSLSHDNQQIAYVMNAGPETSPQVYVMTRGEAQSPSPITVQNSNKFAPHWVLEDSALVYLDDRVNPNRTYLMLHLLDSDESILLPTMQNIHAFDTSPAGDALAYIGSDDRGFSLCVFDLRSSDQTCIRDVGLSTKSRIAWGR